MPTSPPRYIERSRPGFRLAVLIFAAILALAAIWMLAPELARIAGRPISADASAAPGLRTAACAAARLAVVRGDLWSECALAQQPFQMGRQSGALEQARTAAERAVVLAPHDAMAWLILANLESRLDWITRRATAALKMSYYTGPNETSLIPQRLRVATGSEMLADEGVQDLVRHEIRTIIIHRPELKQSISAAYRDAPPDGKRFLELAVGELDMNLLASLRSGTELR